MRALRGRGENPVLALLVGGGEKLGLVPLEVGVPVEPAVDEPERALASAIDRVSARRVIDVSDDPVVDYRLRCRLASVALWKGAEYTGADFSLIPPDRSLRPPSPAIGVIGTGKRTGKTAICGAAARLYRGAGLNPVIVAMGRGGPPEPEVITEGEDLSPRVLLEWALSGRHAASDYIEDALMAGVPTVGAWRAGGGLAGATAFTNYAEALERAAFLAPGLLLLEGSGSAIPPAHWDAGVLVVNASIYPEALCGYFGLYRLLLSDLVVLTMVEESIDRSHLSAVEECLQSAFNQPKVIHTVFRPHPLGDIAGKKIWLGTTAGEAATRLLALHLEQKFGAQVIATSTALADRERLGRDLAPAGEAKEAEVLVTELKAAAVDVVTRTGVERGIEVIYLDNRPEEVAGGRLEEELLALAEKAKERFV